MNAIPQAAALSPHSARWTVAEVEKLYTSCR
jgi:hypothetical protein